MLAWEGVQEEGGLREREALRHSAHRKLAKSQTSEGRIREHRKERDHTR